MKFSLKVFVLLIPFLIASYFFVSSNDSGLVGKIACGCVPTAIFSGDLNTHDNLSDMTFVFNNNEQLISKEKFLNYFENQNFYWKRVQVPKEIVQDVQYEFSFELNAHTIVLIQKLNNDYYHVLEPSDIYKDYYFKSVELSKFLLENIE